MRLIDADELKKKIEIEYNNNVGSYCDGLLGAEELIDNAPTVDIWQLRQEATENALKKAEVLYGRPQGKWIKGKEISRTMIGDKVEHIEYKDYTCSNCGLVLDNLLYNYDGSPFYKFCPNCGAYMRKGEEE